MGLQVGAHPMTFHFCQGSCSLMYEACPVKRVFLQGGFHK